MKKETESSMNRFGAKAFSYLARRTESYAEEEKHKEEMKKTLAFPSTEGESEFEVVHELMGIVMEGGLGSVDRLIT